MKMRKCPNVEEDYVVVEGYMHCLLPECNECIRARIGQEVKETYGTERAGHKIHAIAGNWVIAEIMDDKLLLLFHTCNSMGVAVPETEGPYSDSPGYCHHCHELPDSSVVSAYMLLLRARNLR